MNENDLARRLKQRPVEFVPPPPLCDQVDKVADGFLADRETDILARNEQARSLWGGDK